MSGKPLKGTYCLLINLKHDSEIDIGKMGKIGFKRGHYVYIGSAHNSLEGRIKRHLRDDKKLHWHIDHFLASQNTEISDVLFTVNPVKWECKIAEEICLKAEGVKNFGCSDCKCDSHLFFSEEFVDLKKSCLNAFDKLNLSVEIYEK